MEITVTLIFLVFFAGSKAQSKSCIPNKGILTCQCAPNEELEISSETTEIITSLNISLCASVKLAPPMGQDIENTITSIRLENITNMVYFRPLLYAINLSEIEFLNVGNLVDFIGEYSFPAFTRLDYFHIENTVIGTFKQSFNLATVEKFVLKNVTISNLLVLEFSQGSEFEIIDSYINVTTNTSLFFQTFDNIKIANTTFNFPHGGKIFISGTHIHLKNNTFFNASVNVTGKHGIHLIDTCAEGHGSAMRLYVTKPHQSIVSRRNKMPSQIIYKPKINDTDYICPGARCDCPHIRPLMRPTTAPPVNWGKTIHKETRREFLLCFIIIASTIVARI